MLREQARVLLVNNGQHNYDAEGITVTSQVAQVCAEDNIRLAVNFFNMNGLMDLDSIVWETPCIETIPKADQLSKANKKVKQFMRCRISGVATWNGSIRIGYSMSTSRTLSSDIKWMVSVKA